MSKSKLTCGGLLPIVLTVEHKLVARAYKYLESVADLDRLTEEEAAAADGDDFDSDFEFESDCDSDVEGDSKDSSDCDFVCGGSDSSSSSVSTGEQKGTVWL